jgi:hypothetical protein
MPLILEGIVVTRNADGTPNVSPMGPIVDAAESRLTLRPFQTSQTYQNLKRNSQGVFHITDDVLLIARAVTGTLAPLPETLPATAIDGLVLADCCRWWEFEVVSLDDRDERTTIETGIVHKGRRRDFFGFNRAKHAVLETAILATRLFLLPRDEVLSDVDRHAVVVAKTAGEPEQAAFELLRSHIERYYAEHPPRPSSAD